MNQLRLPHQHHQRKPQPCANLASTSIPSLIRTIQERVRRANRYSGCPSHLFIDRSGNVFMLSDDSPSVLDWIADRFADYVGCYSLPLQSGKALKNRHTLEASAEGIREDIEAHLLQRPC